MSSEWSETSTISSKNSEVWREARLTVLTHQKKKSASPAGNNHQEVSGKYHIELSEELQQSFLSSTHPSQNLAAFTSTSHRHTSPYNQDIWTRAHSVIVQHRALSNAHNPSRQQTPDNSRSFSTRNNGHQSSLPLSSETSPGLSDNTAIHSVADEHQSMVRSRSPLRPISRQTHTNSTTAPTQHGHLSSYDPRADMTAEARRRSRESSEEAEARAAGVVRISRRTGLATHAATHTVSTGQHGYFRQKALASRGVRANHLGLIAAHRAARLASSHHHARHISERTVSDKSTKRSHSPHS